MTTSERSSVDEHRKHAEAIVAWYVREIFSRLPMLAAFGLRHDFEVADLSICTWSGCGVHRDLCEVVMQSLVELAEAHPEAVQLMRGRTFARTVH